MVDKGWSNASPGSRQVQDPKEKRSLLLDVGEFGGSSSESERGGGGEQLALSQAGS